MIFIFDIDGTVADIDHRLHHITGEKQDWRTFYSECSKDRPIKEVIEVAQSLTSFGNKIIALTGRSEEIRKKTEDWLMWNGVYITNLLMRKEGDHRTDAVIKSEMLDKILTDRDISEIGGVFEDRQQCVDMFRARGLRVFQVAPGNF